MPAPERRTRWDLIAAAVLTVGVVVVCTVLWWTSDARRTTLITAAGPVPDVSAPAAGPAGVPVAVTEAWRAPSPATPVPLVRDGTVVTGAAGVVTGRDLHSGAVRWSYRRDRPL